MKKVIYIIILLIKGKSNDHLKNDEIVNYICVHFLGSLADLYILVEFAFP